MKSLKKIISGLSAAVFAFTAVPFAASAEDLHTIEPKEIAAVGGNSNASNVSFAEDMVDPALRDTCGLGCIDPIELPDGYYEKFVSEYEYDGIAASLSDTDTYSYAMIKYNCESRGGDYAELEQAVDAVASQMSSYWTDFRKALFIHDYLARRCQYSRGCARGEDYDFIVHSAYSALCMDKGITVCQGYAEAFWLIAKEVGLECRIVWSDDIWHSWNMVKVNGSWYQVDVTWDDNYLIDTMSTYDHFLVTDATMKKNHIKDQIDWHFHYEGDETCPFVNSTLCSSTAYEGCFWRKERVSAPMVINGSDFYAVCSGSSREPGLYKVGSSGSGTATKLASFDYYSWINNYGYVFSGLALTKGNTLIFNDEARIYAYYINSGKTDVLADISSQITYPEPASDGRYYPVEYLPGKSGSQTTTRNIYSTCPVFYGVKHENETIVAVISVVGVGPCDDDKYVQSYDPYNYNPLTISASNTTSGVKINWTTSSNFTSYRVYRKLSSASGLGSLIATVGTGSYTDTTAANNTSYTYNVIGFNSSLCLKSRASNNVTITASKSSSVAAPVITATNSTSGPVIKWNAVSGATSYTVYRCETYSGTKTKLKTIATTSYTDTTAVSGKSYYYWVTAYNSKIGAGSAYSKQAYITVSKGSSSKLSAPTYLSKSATASGILIKWNPVTSATSYSVYRSSTYSGTKTKIKTTGYTSYCDSTAVPGKSYYYWVTAYNSKTGQTSAYSTQYYVTMPAAPFAPTFTDRYPISSGAYLKWSSVLGATSYKVYRSDSYSGSKILLKTVGTTSYTDTSAVAGKSYYYWVTAYNSKTGKGSGYSKQAYVTMPATSISTPKFTSISTYSNSNDIDFEWSAVSGATSYTIYRATSATGAKTKLKTVGNNYTTITLSGSEVTTTYYYYVVANNSKAGVSSGYSNYIRLRRSPFDSYWG